MIRAWLIALIREAVRAENESRWEALVNEGDVKGSPVAPALNASWMTPRAEYPGRLDEPKPLEPSFEQMQADALAAQEKYYEPRKD